MSDIITESAALMLSCVAAVVCDVVWMAGVGGVRKGASMPDVT